MPWKAYWTSVSSFDIVVEFAGILGLERCGFEFDDYVAAQVDMVEEHIQFAGSSCDDNLFLSAEVCETCPEFKEKAGEVFFEFGFEGFFFVSFFEGEEAEVVGVFGDSLCKFALRGREFVGEV